MLNTKNTYIDINTNDLAADAFIPSNFSIHVPWIERGKKCRKWIDSNLFDELNGRANVVEREKEKKKNYLKRGRNIRSAVKITDINWVRVDDSKNVMLPDKNQCLVTKEWRYRLIEDRYDGIRVLWTILYWY